MTQKRGMYVFLYIMTRTVLPQKLYLSSRFFGQVELFTRAKQSPEKENRRT